MSNECAYILDEQRLFETARLHEGEFRAGEPFPHIVVDDFLPKRHAQFLTQKFPGPDHPVWLDWRTRSSHQYGKLGPGNASKFSLLEPQFQLAIQEFNSWKFLSFLEKLTGFQNLLPDPYFVGGGMHMILNGGILDIHTDFNAHPKFDLFRQLNVLLYLNEEWQPSFGGCLELWGGELENRRCVKSISPLFNRLVVFHTSKRSFHGHPEPWNAPEPITRKSIALYYYTTSKLVGYEYDGKTDFQRTAEKPLPE